MYVFYPHILSTVHSPDKRSARYFFSQSATQPAAQSSAQSISDSTPPSNEIGAHFANCSQYKQAELPPFLFSQTTTQPAAQSSIHSITESTSQATRSEHIFSTVHNPDRRSARHFFVLSQPLSQQLSQAPSQSLSQRLS